MLIPNKLPRFYDIGGNYVDMCPWARYLELDAIL